jgi:hypothetical protein
MSSANLTDNDCELFLTVGKNASIGAALPRSSNGKTTDSDSGTEWPLQPIVRNSDPVFASRSSAGFQGDCELSAILSDLNRAKVAFQLRTICAVLGVK